MIKLEEWLSPRSIQPDCGFFSEEEKQEPNQIKYSAPEESTISNQDREGEISTMVFIKWSDSIKGPSVKIYGPLCGGLYKEDHGYIVPWSEIDTYAKMNNFTWSKEENYFIVLRCHYNEEFSNWRGPINNGQFRPHNLKEKSKT